MEVGVGALIRFSSRAEGNVLKRGPPPIRKWEWMLEQLLAVLSGRLSFNPIASRPFQILINSDN